MEVAADEPPVQGGIIQDANRHREEGDVVAAAKRLIPRELTGDHPGMVRSAEQPRRVAGFRFRIEHHHAQVERSLYKSVAQMRFDLPAPLPTPIELSYPFRHC